MANEHKCVCIELTLCANKYRLQHKTKLWFELNETHSSLLKTRDVLKLALERGEIEQSSYHKTITFINDVITEEIELQIAKWASRAGITELGEYLFSYLTPNTIDGVQESITIDNI
jgi:hypothetical protein